MKKIALASAAIAILSTLAGCASMTPTYETEEAYVVLDGAGAPTQALNERLLTDITNAVRSNVSSVRASRSIPPVPLPAKAGEFSLKEPFAGTSMGSLIQASGGNMKMPVCETPVLTLKSDDSSMARYGEKTTFFVCVMPFVHGYRTAVYATFSRASGGFSAATLGASIGRQLVGDSAQFIPRVINDVKKVMQSDLQNVQVVQSYIPDSFSGPMVDQRSAVQASK